MCIYWCLSACVMCGASMHVAGLLCWGTAIRYMLILEAQFGLWCLSHS